MDLRKITLPLLVFIFMLTPAAFAQQDICQTLARNQICNAGGLVEIDGASQSGDIVEANNVTQVVTRLPEQASDAPPPTLAVTSNSNANVRSGPSTNDTVVGSLQAGETVTADGRIADGSWFRITLADGTVGWIFAQLVAADGDIGSLAIVDPAAEPTPQPGMAVLRLQSTFPNVLPERNLTMVVFGGASVENTSDDAPFQRLTLAGEGGLLIQTPNNAGSATLNINGIPFEFVAATALLQNGEAMRLLVLDGLVLVGESGARQAVPQGAQLDVGSGDIAPYDALESLPLASLPNLIEAAPAAVDVDAAGIPTSGEWEATFGLADYTCGEDVEGVDDRLDGRTTPRTLNVQGDTILLGLPDSDDVLAEPALIEPHIFYAEFPVEADPSVMDMLTWWVISPDYIQGWEVDNFVEDDCIRYLPFELRLQVAS